MYFTYPPVTGATSPATGLSAGDPGISAGITLDSGTEHELCSLNVLGRSFMIKAVLQEAATLAALSLFVGMIAIWSQVISNL